MGPPSCHPRRCLLSGVVPELARRPGPLPGRDLGVSFWRPGLGELERDSSSARCDFCCFRPVRACLARPPLRASRGPHDPFDTECLSPAPSPYDAPIESESQHENVGDHLSNVHGVKYDPRMMRPELLFAGMQLMSEDEEDEWTPPEDTEDEDLLLILFGRG